MPHCLLHVELNSAQLVACGVIALLTGVNIRGVREGAFVQNLFTVLKVAALVALIVAGLGRSGGSAHFFPLIEPMPGKEALQVGFMAGLAVALSKALFAYDAWYTVTFVAEEVHDSHRTLPRALLLGCLLVTVLYVLTNVAYLCVLPVSEIAAVPENRVAERVAVVLFGNIGSTLIIVAILVSTFGCVNGMILGGARVCYAMAREGLFFRSCAKLGMRKTPRDGAAVPGRLGDGPDADRLVLGVAHLQHVRLGPFRRPDGGCRLPPAFQAAGRSTSLSLLGLSGHAGNLPGDLPGVSGLCRPGRSAGHNVRSPAGASPGFRFT